MGQTKNPGRLTISIDKDKLSVLILSGGAGRRLNGRDKGLEPWQGRTLIEHAIAYFSPRCSQLLLSCNRNLDRYRSLGYPVVKDIREDYQGPLAGLEAAVPLVEKPFLAIGTCDTPRLPPDLLERLAAPFERRPDSQPDLTFASDGARDHYLCALLSTRCLSSLHDYLEGGGRAVKHWYRCLEAERVLFDEGPEAFYNHNRPA